MQGLADRLLMFFLLIISFGWLNVIFNHGMIFNADNFAYLSLYQDLFNYHYSLTGWQLMVKPNIIFIMPLFTLFWKLTHNIGLVLFVLQLLALIGFTTLFFLINQKLYPEHYPFTLLPLLTLMAYYIVAAAIVPKWFDGFISPCRYFPTLLLTLLCLYLVLKQFYRSNFLICSLLGTLCCLGVISDQLLLPMLTVPYLSAFLLCRRRGITLNYHLTFSILLGSVFGFILIHYVLAIHYINHLFSWPSLRNFLQAIPIIIFASGTWLGLVIAVSIFWTIYCVVRYSCTPWVVTQNSAIATGPFIFFIYYLCSMVFCLSSAVFVFGYFKQLLSMHYLLAILLFLPAAMLSYGAVCWGELFRCNWTTRASYAFLLVLVVSLIMLFHWPAEITSTVFHPSWLSWSSPDVECVDHNANLFYSRYGLAEYWLARPITLFSKQRLWVNAVGKRGVWGQWLNNIYWYTQDKDNRYQLPTYSFIILDRRLTERGIGLPFSPEKIISCRRQGFDSKSRIYIYNTSSAVKKLNQILRQRNYQFLVSNRPVS